MVNKSKKIFDDAQAILDLVSLKINEEHSIRDYYGISDLPAYFSNKLKEDIDFCDKYFDLLLEYKETIKIKKILYQNYGHIMNNHFSKILEHFGNKVKNNKELVIKACQLDGRNLEFCSPSLSCDYDVVQSALSSHLKSAEFSYRE